MKRFWRLAPMVLILALLPAATVPLAPDVEYQNRAVSLRGRFRLVGNAPHPELVFCTNSPAGGGGQDYTVLPPLPDAGLVQRGGELAVEGLATYRRDYLAGSTSHYRPWYGLRVLRIVE